MNICVLLISRLYRRYVISCDEHWSRTWQWTRGRRRETPIGSGLLTLMPGPGDRVWPPPVPGLEQFRVPKGHAARRLYI
jgi:hypothetical protein